jgi:hypothetical protein
MFEGILSSNEDKECQKKKKDCVSKPRSKLNKHYKENDFNVLKSLEGIAMRASVEPYAQYDNLMEIISNENFLYQAMGNITNKKGL